MQVRQIAFLLIGFLLVTTCVEEPDDLDLGISEDDNLDISEDDEDQLGETHDVDPPDDEEEEEKPIPWVPLGKGPHINLEDPIEEDLSSDQVHKIFRFIDDDQDGKLSMQELLEFGEHTQQSIAKKRASILLSEVDENDDGKASLAELPHVTEWLVANGFGFATVEDYERHRVSDDMVDPIEAAKFEAADHDANGGLDQHELPALFYPQMNEDVLHAQTAAKLKRLDRDGDQQLTEDEFYWGMEGRYQDEAVMQKMKSDFVKLDKNSNGQINTAEMHIWESGSFSLQEAMKHLFLVADKNADHQITVEEIDKIRPKIWGTPTSGHIREWCDHHEL